MSRVLLIVEGTQDIGLVKIILKLHRPNLAELVEARAIGGVGNFWAQPAEDDVLDAAVKSEAKAIAIVCDADKDSASRWRKLRKAFLKRQAGHELPHHLPPSGLISVGPDTRGLGCWVMPDNSGQGAIEGLLLRSLQPGAQSELAEKSINFVRGVQPRQFPDTKSAYDKAALATLLAIQAEPYWVPAKAIEHQKLKLDEASLLPFLDWLEQLSKI